MRLVLLETLGDGTQVSTMQTNLVLRGTRDYETAVFDPSGAMRCSKQYDTELEAKAGHLAAVAVWKKHFATSD